MGGGGGGGGVQTAARRERKRRVAAAACHSYQWRWAKSGTEADENSGVTSGPALALTGITDFIVTYFFCGPEYNGIGPRRRAERQGSKMGGEGGRDTKGGMDRYRYREMEG